MSVVKKMFGARNPKDIEGLRKAIPGKGPRKGVKKLPDAKGTATRG